MIHIWQHIMKPFNRENEWMTNIISVELLYLKPFNCVQIELLVFQSNT